MKKIILTLTLLLSVIAGAFAQDNNAVYVYRNDGEINAFLKADIESIEFSNYDIDSLYHKDLQTQVVYTSDSIYKIPLAVIDSVSFVTPPTILNGGVVDISNSLWDYVVESNELSFTLRSDIPSHLIPTEGTKLVYMTMDEKFPAGFAGEVSNVSNSASGYIVSCKRVKLEDVFETYYNVTSLYGYAEENNSKEANKQLRRVESFANREFKLRTFSWSKSTELSRKISDKDVAIKGGTELGISVTPQFHVISTLIINKETGTYFSACITGDISLEEHISVYGGIEWAPDFLDNDLINVPIAPYTKFYVKPGLFVNASAVASASAVWTQRFTTAVAFDFSSKGQNVLRPTCGGRLESHSFDIEGCVDGRLAAGFFTEIGVTLIDSDIDKLCFRGELGAELVGHAVLYNSEIDKAKTDTTTYVKFKNSNIEANTYVNTSAIAELGPWGVSRSLPWNLSYNLKSWDVVPEFSNSALKKSKTEENALDAYTEISGDCLVPVGIGLSLFNEANEPFDSYYASTKFDNGNKYCEHTFSSTDLTKEFTLYPKINFLGYEMLASPIAKYIPKQCYITEFKQTDSSYDKDSYFNDGRYYDYKFDCATTVAIDDKVDRSKVEDWGYVYKDPEGQEKHISLKAFSSPYTDSRYAYYRNESSSTATLYGYIKYKGDNEYYYDDPKDYPLNHGQRLCPDDHHPHAIDLGLPSGTKWACCNVGASSPEKYGGYYAWGETSEKSVYNWDTYQYGSSWDNCQNIGSDIAETSYDVAHVRMGAPWRMPSHAQQEELMNNCTRTWTQQNGVNGILVTGKNGGQLFLPAAGWRFSSDDLRNAGSCGIYWSSSPVQSYVGACYLGFYSDYWSWEYGNREGGLSVRAVCP